MIKISNREYQRLLKSYLSNGGDPNNSELRLFGQEIEITIYDYNRTDEELFAEATRQ